MPIKVPQPKFPRGCSVILKIFMTQITHSAKLFLPDTTIRLVHTIYRIWPGFRRSHGSLKRCLLPFLQQRPPLEVLTSPLLSLPSRLASMSACSYWLEHLAYQQLLLSASFLILL